MTQMLTLGFSPCPNDTFIFDALVHGRVDCGGLRFEVRITDVEELNRAALAGELDVTKLSIAALADVADQYALLDSGAALGRGCGPLLIAREPEVVNRLEQARIAIPGRMTTAWLLLRQFSPRIGSVDALLFSEIEDAVARGHYDAGLIIHESRFTYADKGLVALADLGAFWEQRTGLPIPLGGIAVRRALPAAVRITVARAVRASVEHAFAHPADSRPFIRHHAQTMDETVMQRHIDLYVNDFTRSLGEEGRRAILRLLNLAENGGLFEPG